MAHPMRDSAREGHNAKLRAMTDHYGLGSGPENNILAETNRMKREGPEDAVGFGADASAASAKRGDRPARRTTAANPLATYRRGGAVKRADGGDVSAIEMANKDQAATTSRARGGRTKGKHGNTHVNVMIAPQGGGAGAPPPHPVIAPPMGGMPPPMPPRPPMPPMGAAPPMGGAGPAGPMMPPPPGLPPPGMMPPRADGGRIEKGKKSGTATDTKTATKTSTKAYTQGNITVTGGAGKGSTTVDIEVPRGKTKGKGEGETRASGGRVHEDEAEDKGLIKRTLKEEGLVRSDKAEKEPLEGETARARGGMVHLTGGAGGGLGRLEKAEAEKRRGHGKAQVV